MGSLELSNDETFFQGILNNQNISFNGDEEIKFPSTTPSDAENGSKKTRKSKNSQKTKVSKGEDVENKNKSEEHLEKENITLGKLKNKRRSNRLAQKDARQPLKVLNREVSEKDETKILYQNLSEKENSFPSGEEVIKKQNLLFEKIIIYENEPSQIPKKEDLGEENHQSSEPCDNLKTENVPQGRLSLKENKINSPAIPLRSRAGKSRYSTNDLSNIKSINDKKNELLFAFKNGCFDKKGLVRAKPLRKSSPNPKEMENVFAELEAAFPNVDPEYLRAQCIKLKGSLRDTIEVVLIKEKTDGLPTKADYLKRLETEKLQTIYKNNFSIEKLLKIIPNPWEYFLNSDAKNRIRYANHSFYYLKNAFKKHYLQAIQEIFIRNDFSLYLSCKELQKKNRTLKMRATNRSKMECDAGKPTTFNIDFMHEVAFIENENKIKSHIRKFEIAKNKRFKQAEKAGSLMSCQSCHETNLLYEDTINCSADHYFCKFCVVRFVTVEVEKENIHFKCLLKCEGKFSPISFQEILGPAELVSIIQRIQSEETKSRAVDSLIYCPFCYHLTILPTDVIILRCPNPACTLQSCRLCKQLDHTPSKCNEEDSELNKTEIENSIINSPPSCIICKEGCISEEGEDKIACSCGATICSDCRRSFPDCPHFNTNFEVKEHSPSYSSDESEFEEATECELQHPGHNYDEENSNTKFYDPTENVLDFASTDSISF